MHVCICGGLCPCPASPVCQDKTHDPRVTGPAVRVLGGSRAPGPHAHGNTARQVVDGLRTEVCGQQKQSNDPRNNQHNPRWANYWAPLTRKRHIPPRPAQPRHTNDWAPRTRKQHQQEHRPQRPTESSDPTQHAKGRTGDCPGPRKETTTRRNATQGGRRGSNKQEKWRALGSHPRLVDDTRSVSAILGAVLNAKNKNCQAPVRSDRSRALAGG